MEMQSFQKFRKNVKDNIEKVIIGKGDNIDKIIVAFICSGHVLLDDVPGLGKTKLAKSLAKSMNCTFNRIQFTPDVLPSDLTGIYYYNQKEQEFQFRQGPLMSQIILADEINRATPRTQSALLECMEEKQITVEGHTMKLNTPFFVIATQNPVEQFGTFPLPEAQLDRFFIKLRMGYPQFSEEKEMMERFMKEDPLSTLEAAVTLEEISYVQQNYTNVHVNDNIKNYILEIITATRTHRDIELGCSPRATLNLMKGCQAFAAINGRDYVIPEDVKTMAIPILSHRLILKNEMNSGFNRAEAVIEKILQEISTPLEEI